MFYIVLESFRCKFNYRSKKDFPADKCQHAKSYQRWLMLSAPLYSCWINSSFPVFSNSLNLYFNGQISLLLSIKTQARKRRDNLPVFADVHPSKDYCYD